ncbi:D-aminoacyl-tRNA deacylase [Halobacteriovorax sp. HLS]|uniref:D-aminoacyl-tRNA deacylase n=1 Tax=Halobacteriovorax sp. HLS TaxID=2234000 RepID=UPI000FD6D823|nr:D-aminoacyl-tRNA deacylase [Halobacteriovorax sp. HLS]
MKIVVQRSKASSVKVGDSVVGSIKNGLVLLVCFEKDDTEIVLDKSIEKILALRIFPDENLKMNKNIIESSGEVLAISQFTLSWNGKKGNRPSFDNSMAPDMAEKLFIEFCERLKQSVTVETGAFGELMEVSITNDGPVTFHLDF